jgi:hypothetical protein
MTEGPPIEVLSSVYRLTLRVVAVSRLMGRRGRDLARGTLCCEAISTVIVHPDDSVTQCFAAVNQVPAKQKGRERPCSRAP